MDDVFVNIGFDLMAPGQASSLPIWAGVDGYTFFFFRQHRHDRYPFGQWSVAILVQIHPRRFDISLPIWAVVSG